MPLKEVGVTPEGYTIYVETGEHGGDIYWSDEIGGGVMIWDTMISPLSLEFAINNWREDWKVPVGI